jgi:hypothetical protein
MNMKKKTNEAEVFDFKKEYKYLYTPKPGKPGIVEVPDFKYIMIDGQGYPGTSEEFCRKMQVLYGLAYTIKFGMKLDKENPFDFKVAACSGLWHADDMTAFAEEGRKEEWKWTIMILQPDQVNTAIFEKAKEELKKKKNPPDIDRVYFKVYQEGLCAQVMHIGPYDREKPTIEMLHKFFKDRGYTFNGRHHEIYLGDPRRTQPEKLKTIIRQPIKKV